MENIYSTLILLLAALFFLVMPLVFTVFNILNLFLKKPIHATGFEIATLLCGPLMTGLLYGLLDFKDYDSPINLWGGTQVHAPVDSQYLWTVILLGGIGLIGYILVRFYHSKLPPLAFVLGMAMMMVGCIECILWIIQLGKGLAVGIGDDLFWILYLCLFPINFILCCLSASLRAIQAYPVWPVKQYKNPFVSKCAALLSQSKHWPWLGILVAVPVLLLVVLIITLFGQAPDAVIRAFTETSDWTLSQKISPPPVQIDTHYLCTVSLQGHRKLVRPTRYGIRRGERIVVNRQLCVANAFEQLVQERTPHLHRLIRYVYDTYGYPISRHIKTALAADMVYLIMKPLEWLFLVALYLFDPKPEDRIALQYLPPQEVKRLKQETEANVCIYDADRSI